jgi:hypothetical protein
MNKLATILAAGVFLTACAIAPQENLWPAITARDVQAAYELVAVDHPAMADELSVRPFRASFEAGRALALERAHGVRDYDGYRAVLAGLAVSAGDKHIWSRPNYQPEVVQWAGLIMTRRGNRYVVLEQEDAPPDASLVGSALTSCDGVSADEFAAQKLGGFRAVWSIEAQRIQRAPELFIDEGNPFVLRPLACVFEQEGKAVAHTLVWRAILRSDLIVRTRPARNRGAAGFGVRPFAGGLWISLQSLDDRAPAVVDAVRAQEAALRGAPIVVLDLRGNGGGNSTFGRQIATVLFGTARTGKLLEGGSCRAAWRLSARNIAQIREFRERFATSAPEFAAEMDEQLAAADAALAAGREFTGPTTCPSSDAPAADEAPPAARGRIVLLTDNTCFSSCLMVTDDFRRLGALHVGQATDANTHYMEVREERLPSGLSMFSTLQAINPQMPPQLGPFVPAERYDGDIADTAALETWIATGLPQP